MVIKLDPDCLKGVLFSSWCLTETFVWSRARCAVQRSGEVNTVNNHKESSTPAQQEVGKNLVKTTMEGRRKKCVVLLDHGEGGEITLTLNDVTSYWNVFMINFIYHIYLAIALPRFFLLII